MSNIVRPKFATRKTDQTLQKVARKMSSKACDVDRLENEIFVRMHGLKRAGERERLSRVMDLALELMAKIDVENGC